MFDLYDMFMHQIHFIGVRHTLPFQSIENGHYESVFIKNTLFCNCDSKEWRKK